MRTRGVDDGFQGVEDDLLSQIRQQGVPDLRQVREARMEGDGHISVIKVEESREAEQFLETARALEKTVRSLQEQSNTLETQVGRISAALRSSASARRPQITSSAPASASRAVRAVSISMPER